MNYQHYTGRTWGQSQNYDICLRTSTISIEESARIIIDAVEKSREK